MTKNATLSDIAPAAVMTEAELAAWEALPADVQFARLRAAVDRVVASGVTTRTMDEILDGVLARHRDAKL